MEKIFLVMLFFVFCASAFADVKTVRLGENKLVTKVEVSEGVGDESFKATLTSLSASLKSSSSESALIESKGHGTTFQPNLSYIKLLLRQSMDTTENLANYLNDKMDSNPFNLRLNKLSGKLEELSAYTFGQERVGTFTVKGLKVGDTNTLIYEGVTYNYIIGPGLDETSEKEREVIVVDCSIPNGAKLAIGLLRYVVNDAEVTWDPRLFPKHNGFLIYHNIDDLGPAAMKHMQCGKPFKEKVAKKAPAPKCESTCGSVVENKAL